MADDQVVTEVLDGQQEFMGLGPDVPMQTFVSVPVEGVAVTVPSAQATPRPASHR